MTESQICTKLVLQIKRSMNGAVPFKHADRSTVGLPDISCTWLQRTSWIEVKYLRPHQTKLYPDRVNLAAVCTPGGESAAQLETMRRLSKQSQAFYLMYMKDKIMYVDGSFAWEKILIGSSIAVPFTFDPVASIKDNVKCFMFPDNDINQLKLIAYFHGATTDDSKRNTNAE